MAAPRRLGIVGCGGATRKLHLPALSSQDAFQLVALVDVVASHARAAADEWSGEILATADLEEILPLIDAAIVASSSGTHADIATTLLRAGKHVLVEKPMALSIEQAERIRSAAHDGGVVVRPGHVRRLFPLTAWVKSVMDSGRLGRIQRVLWTEGEPYGWGVASAGIVGPPSDGGGVIADTGPHVLDTLRFWFGDGRIVELATNSAGGTDSEAAISLAYGDVAVEVALSRLRTLDGILIEGTLGSLTVENDIDDAGYVERDASGEIRDSGPIPALPEAAPSWEQLFVRQLIEFDRAIAGLDTPLATVDDGIAVAGMLETAREIGAPSLPHPWVDTRRLASSPQRVAITGATGFIGSHTVERMVNGPGKTEVVAVGRNFKRLVRLSHLDRDRVRYARSDIRDRAALKEIFRDCDVVVHTVFDASDGTAAVIGAALDAGVRRLVHISTVDVYDTVGGTLLDENCPRVAPATGEQASYAQQKLADEELVLAVPGGLEVVSLQPTIVYGPWGSTWTMSVLEDDLPHANHTLPTGPDTGICNALHVHDLADAIHFVATAPGVDHLRLLVSGPEPIAWGEFYDAHRRIAGIDPPQRYDSSEVPEPDRTLYASPVVVSTERLAALGFRPEIGIAQGLSQLAGWARWAGLISG